MMGTKVRSFTPLVNVSLEELVPRDHFYRHLERTLDLSFVREFVQDTYAGGGRPSIDPVVFFKLQLVMFFEGLRSERQLMRHAADRLSVLWYLSYDLGEPLPDHSSLTRIRERYEVEVFRRFFEKIVELCQQAGLVWGKELYVDATKVKANASLDSLTPRFAVEAHLANVFAEEAAEEQATSPAEAACGEPGEHQEPPVPLPFPVTLSQEERETLSQDNEERHDWIEQGGAQNRSVTGRCYQRIADLRVSTTDPDATIMLHKDGSHLRYQAHYLVDGGTSRIILTVLVTPAEVMENQPMLDLIWRARFRWKLWPRQVTGDSKYGTEENIVAIEDQHIRAYVPLPDNDHRTEFFSADRFRYETERDVYHCPAAKNCAWISRIRPSDRCVIGHAPRSASTARSKPSVPQVSRDEPSVAVSMKTIWIGCGPTMPPNPTRKRTANAVSGSNRYLLRRKTGMAYAAFGCACSGASTVRRCGSLPGKISSGCSKSVAGGAALSQSRRCAPSFGRLFGA